MLRMLVMISFLVSTQAFALGYVQSTVETANGEEAILFEVYLDRKAQPQVCRLVAEGEPVCETFPFPIGWAAFVLITEGWGEAYVGPTVAPTEWLELTAFAGVQQGDKGLEARYAASVFLQQQPFALLASVEFDHHGTEGVWYDCIATGSWDELITVGIQARRYVGIGPRIEVSGSDGAIKFWGSWTPIDPEQQQVLDGARGMIGLMLIN